MASDYIYTLSSYSAVLSREDVDGTNRHVLLVDDRRCNVANRIIFDMSPALARQVAGRLKKHADFLDPPKPKKVRRG